MPAHERRWPASATVLAVLILQVAQPAQMRGRMSWTLIAIEVALLIPVVLANPVALRRDTMAVRVLGVSLSILLVVANGITLLVLIGRLLGQHAMAPTELVRAGLLIWLTNVAALAIAFWESDRGGPFARDPRHGRTQNQPDLLFPQMLGVPGWDAEQWRPSFADYLFVAFTSATAFSPTDTLPLSARAKLQMTIASGVSLLTIAVLLARAVNVL